MESPSTIVKSTNSLSRELLRLGAAALFVLLVYFVAKGQAAEIASHSGLLIVASVFGAYMALNIGANDVANNVGPAVGSKALSMVGAILIAAIFEAAGALIAGGEVVSTIKNGIIQPSKIGDVNLFVWAMMAALLAGALWLNLATAIGAPVSTTHSIVGGVLGAGVAAGGMEVANWSQMGGIAASWVISPVLGGVIAAAFLYLIKRTITYKADMLAAANTMVPVLVTVMAWAFGSYLLLKGTKNLIKLDFGQALIIGAVLAGIIFMLVRPMIRKASSKMANNKDSINNLFNIPLIFAAALLSFAHGANDVANAIGPLAAINEALLHGAITEKAGIPLWVMLIGALGISVGLALYGPKLIKTVGSEITELDKMRAYCIALSAALTVIVASKLGLPVSSTHIAVGAVFGVGFLREYLKTSYEDMVREIHLHHQDASQEDVDAFLQRFEQADVREKKQMLRELKAQSGDSLLNKKEIKGLKKATKRELVKRSAIYKIVAAWIITVPVSALLAAFIFFAIRGFMLP
ncbi:inorganic phosphate transporter [Balneatrix alpica]|uniref:inorganic phosphate transporter n=1 Tax=Balneatrix alpica TaxID=75684 RepID=UPI00273854E4|nr:inorganic phosphate transporter [Balneatrix alpica]